jgi:hypothetical protein
MITLEIIRNKSYTPLWENFITSPEVRAIYSGNCKALPGTKFILATQMALVKYGANIDSWGQGYITFNSEAERTIFLLRFA